MMDIYNTIKDYDKNDIYKDITSKLNNWFYVYLCDFVHLQFEDNAAQTIETLKSNNAAECLYLFAQSIIDICDIIVNGKRDSYTYDRSQYKTYVRMPASGEKSKRSILTSNEIIDYETDKFYNSIYTDSDVFYFCKTDVGERLAEGFAPNPTDYNYYLDFINSSAKIGELSVSNIGRRTDAINNTSLNCMIDPDIPTLYLLEDPDNIDLDYHSGKSEQEVKDEIKEQRDELIKNAKMYAYVHGTVLHSFHEDTYQGLYEAARELLYEETSYNEKITLTCLPIYHLDVNTRITVKDVKSGIFGDYLINTISVPLDVESTMNITCTKIIDRV
jgi:hypothetical protein